MSKILSKINWFGLAGGITTLIVVAVSVFVPWWQLTVGDDLLKANASPVNTNFGFLGTVFTIPLIWTFNIVNLLSLVASGVSMTVYSILPAKTYSKILLGFGYKKPLFTVLFFVIGLVVITLVVQALLNFNIPLMGSATNTLPLPFGPGVTLSVFMSTGFQWPFWLAVVAAALCIAARLYHKKVGSASAVSSTASAPKA